MEEKLQTIEAKPMAAERQADAAQGTARMAVQAIGPEQLKKFTQTLEKYKAGKSKTERRIVASENWWKLRNAMEEEKDSKATTKEGFKSVSGWLHNVIVSKHADAMEAYPEPNILPREMGDQGEAVKLSAIIPCIMEQNRFEETYSKAVWQKLKTGTGVYKVVWDSAKLNGLGDIAIEQVNLLNLYWEPGVTDIQRSRYFFHTELYDKDLLEEQYPQLAGKLKGQSFVSTKFLYDDNVSDENKHTVIDVYYHKYVDGRRTLQYCKYVGDVVLYATENETQQEIDQQTGQMKPSVSQRGLYDHGMYPYVFDALYPIEGSPCGYGFVDICRNPQTEIDLLKTSFVKNAMVGAIPRFFSRIDGNVNEEEFLDLTKPIVHVSGNVDEASLRQISYNQLPGVYVNMLNNTIDELRQTSGNTETATGSTTSGVTAASAIAALQEASGKGSRDSTQASYRSYTQIVGMCIELVRQFMTLPRQFRIIGEYGTQQYVSYSNEGLQPQHQGNAFGEDMGYRLPVFDIKVSAQKKNAYTKVSQNELALQFFQYGFFNPQMTDQALLCLEIMDFDGKDTIMQKISRNGTIFQKLAQYMQLCLQMAQVAQPQMVQSIYQDMVSTLGGAAGAGGASSASAKMPESDHIAGIGKAENAQVQNARQRSNEASQPGGGSVTGKGKGK